MVGVGINVDVSKKDKKDIIAWKDRLAKDIQEQLDSLEVLVLTGVLDEEEGDELRLNHDYLKNMDFERLGVIDYIRGVLSFTDKKLEQYPKIQGLYDKYYRNYVESGNWLDDLVLEVFKNYTKQITNNELPKVVLDNGIKDGVTGYVITSQTILETAKTNNLKIFNTIEMDADFKERIVVLVIHQLVKWARENNYNIGITSVETKINTFTGKSQPNKMYELFGVYRISVLGNLRVFITKSHLVLPDVYLPDDGDSRYAFLKAYRQAGFNNEFYEPNK